MRGKKFLTIYEYDTKNEVILSHNFTFRQVCRKLLLEDI